MDRPHGPRGVCPEMRPVPAEGREPRGKVGEHPAGRQFSVSKQVLFSVIIVGTLLVAAEASIRMWALYFRTSYERYNPETGRPPGRMDTLEVFINQAGIALENAFLQRKLQALQGREVS